MIEVMNTGRKEVENCLDPQLWHACAGGMVQMPPVSSKVIYFPQGHIEHAQVNIDFKKYPPLPALVPCRVSSICYLADKETDEVYAKIRLIPIGARDFNLGDDEFVVGDCESGNEFEGSEKPASFAKTLTQSDANNGGGFSVPRCCAETIFPRLDYSAEPPAQTILAKDVHGVTWKFRHIYRGTPRRHLLTTGWSNFVNQKKLVAGDSIVFLRAESGDLCVGIRRAKKGIGGGPESPTSWWNGNGAGGGVGGSSTNPSGGFASFLKDDENKILRGLGRMSSLGESNGGAWVAPIGKMGPEPVIESASLAANGQPFEVVYYPRDSTPPFCVKASTVRAAMQIQWCSGMRFKMAFETEDSSRISWFMGTISAVRVADPIHWPSSPWRLLQVAWDEPDLLQNVKRVNPWSVEMVSSMPTIHMSLFSLPRKKLRLSDSHDFPLIDQMPMMPPPTLSSNSINSLKPSSSSSSPFCCISDNHNISSVGIQGARHTRFTKSFLPDFRLNKTQFNRFPSLVKHQPGSRPVNLACHGFSGPVNLVCKPSSTTNKINEDISCLLTMGNNKRKLQNQSPKRSGDTVTPKFMLFGKPILTEEQISQSSSSGDSSSGNLSSSNRIAEKIATNFSDGSSDAVTMISSDEAYASSRKHCDKKIEFGLFDTAHCKLFKELEDVGRTIDLPVLGS